MSDLRGLASGSSLSVEGRTGRIGAAQGPLGPISWAQMAAWAGRERARGEPVAAWSDPADGLEWVASGAASLTEAPSLHGLVSSCSISVEPELEPGLPRAWVGAAFDPEREWEGFPPALAVIPRRLAWVRRGGGSLTAGVVVWLEDSADAAGELARLREELTRPAPQVPGVHGHGAHAVAVERLASEAPAAWAARVREALAGATRGELEKVVLARAVEHRLPPGRSWDLCATLAGLRAQDPGAIVYAVAPPRAPGGEDPGCFLGATPELLVRLAGRWVEAVALAGTARRGHDPLDDEARAAALLASAKDRREHALVADAVRAALRPACRLLEDPSGPALRRLPRLFHLETRFRGLLHPRTPGVLGLGAALHPTPAVAGAPRAAALEHLRAREPLRRGWFAGPVGWVDGAGGGTLAVALRCARLRGGVAACFAGAGIVPGSDPAAEWVETEGKLATVARALAAAPEAAP